MNPRTEARSAISCRRAWSYRTLLLFVAALLASARMQAQENGSRVVLDRVIAVVNDRPILASELKDEMRVSILEPNSGEPETETPQDALQRLIARTLIRQQIREEEERSLVPSDDEVSQRMIELRKRLPVCVHANCASEAGWNAFLTAHGLTEERVKRYLRNRIETLKFVEIRFRQGTRISPDQVENYYRNTLLPQYPPGQPAPPLDQVSARIEEILLQQQITGLFTDWLENLRKQGDIEILDPSFEAATETAQPSPTQTNPDKGGPAVR
jgi:peptidyl-prolyl cis-trans isomerase SurA